MTFWKPSTWYKGAYGGNYLHDDNEGKGTKSVRFTPGLAAGGTYQVEVHYPTADLYATVVPFDVIHQGGLTSGTFARPDSSVGAWGWVSLGEYTFDAGTSGSVIIRTDGTNDYVVADAVRFVPL